MTVAIDYTKWPWKQHARRCSVDGCGREFTPTRFNRDECFRHSHDQCWGEPSFIYVVESPEAGLIKVGTSKDPAQRLVQLRSTYRHLRPMRLVLTADGCTAEERSLQAALKAHQHEGEWFRADPAVWQRVWTWFESEYESVMAARSDHNSGCGPDRKRPE